MSLISSVISFHFFSLLIAQLCFSCWSILFGAWENLVVLRADSRLCAQDCSSVVLRLNCVFPELAAWCRLSWCMTVCIYHYNVFLRSRQAVSPNPSMLHFHLKWFKTLLLSSLSNPSVFVYFQIVLSIFTYLFMITLQFNSIAAREHILCDLNAFKCTVNCFRDQNMV